MTNSKTSKMAWFNGLKNPAAQAAEPDPTPATPEAEPAQAKPLTKGQKYAPMSVYVSAEQRKIIEQIAKATGQTKHAVLQYAVRKVCNDFEEGIYPEIELRPRLK